MNENADGDWRRKFRRGERVALQIDDSVGMIRLAQPVDRASDSFGWYPTAIQPYNMHLEFDWQDGDPIGTITFVAYLDDDGWTVSFVWRVVDGVATVVDGPHFRPPEGGAAITSRFLRSLAPGVIYDAIEHWLRDPFVAAWLGGEWVALSRKRPGRAGRDDLFYAQWAARYVEALDVDRKPLQRLIREERDACRLVNEKQLRGYLYQARRRKLLTEAPPGRAGGHLTEQANRILEQEGIK